jgi:hypothetical protein
MSRFRARRAVGIDILLAIDAALFLLGRMVVRIGRGRHDSADHGVEGLEQFTPLRAEPGAAAIGHQAVAMAERDVAQPLRGKPSIACHTSSPTRHTKA